MKFSAKIMVAGFLILLELISTGCALKCVRCESFNNPDCTGTMNQNQIISQTKECDDTNENLCVKIKVNAMRTSWYTKNGRLDVATTKISRFCGSTNDYPAAYGLGCWFAWGRAGEGWSCACTGEACNMSPSFAASPIILCVSLLLRWLLP